MENKEFTGRYLDFKKDAVESGLFNLEEILRLFKINMELKMKSTDFIL